MLLTTFPLHGILPISIQIIRYYDKRYRKLKYGKDMRFHLFIPHEKFNRTYVLGRIHYFIMAANNKLKSDGNQEENDEQEDSDKQKDAKAQQLISNTRNHFYQNFFVNEKNFNTFQFDFNTAFTKRVHDFSATNINYLFSSKTKTGREKIKKMSKASHIGDNDKAHNPFSQKIEFEFEYYLDKNKILEEIHKTLKNEERQDLPYMYSDFKPKKRGNTGLKIADSAGTIESLPDRQFHSDYFSFNIQGSKTLMLNELMYELMYNPVYTKPLILNKLTHFFLAYLDTDLYYSLNKSKNSITEATPLKKQKRKINLATLSKIASSFAKEKLGRDISPMFYGELKLQVQDDKNKAYLKSPYIKLGESLIIYPGEINLFKTLEKFDENDVGIFIEHNYDMNGSIGNYDLAFFNKKNKAIESVDNWHNIYFNKKNKEEAAFTSGNQIGTSDTFLKFINEDMDPVHFRLDYVSDINLSMNAFKRYVEDNKRLENIDSPFSEHLDKGNIYIIPKHMRINRNIFSPYAFSNNIYQERSDLDIYKHLHRVIEKKIEDRNKSSKKITYIKNELFDVKIQYCKHGRFYDFNFYQEGANVFLCPDGYIIFLTETDLESFLVSSGCFTKKELTVITEGKLSLKKSIKEHKEFFIPDNFLAHKEES